MLHICRRTIVHLEVFRLMLPRVDWLLFESIEVLFTEVSLNSRPST